MTVMEPFFKVCLQQSNRFHITLKWDDIYHDKGIHGMRNATSYLLWADSTRFRHKVEFSNKKNAIATTNAATYNKFYRRESMLLEISVNTINLSICSQTLMLTQMQEHATHFDRDPKIDSLFFCTPTLCLKMLHVATSLFSIYADTYATKYIWCSCQLQQLTWPEPAAGCRHATDSRW